MRIRVLFVTALLVALPAAGLRADVRTQQKTQVQFAGMLGRVVNLFGGKAAREGVTSTVMVKGDRKVTATDTTSQIIDLAEEKVYDLDLRRKTYKVTTFEELRRQIEEARKRAEADAAQEAKEEGRDADAAAGDTREVEVDFNVETTGETRSIAGFDTRQAIMTITVREKGKTLEEGGGLVLTSDMWLAPEQEAMQEINEFDRRYAEKLYGGLLGVSADQLAMAMAMYPGLKQAMDRMAAEGSKLDGTAMMTTLKIDAVRSAEQMKAQGQDEAPSARGGIGGMLGGLARRAARKKEDPQQRTTFMTSTVEVLKLSTDVAASDVAVPADFKERK